MNKKKELIKNTIIIFIGRASTQLISLFLLPLYTSYINTSEYGIVDLINTYITLIVPVLTLELDMATFRFLIDYRNDVNGRKKVLSNVLLCLVIISTIFVPIYLLVNKVLNFKYSILILFNIITSIYSTVMIQVARGLGKNTDYSIACGLGGITTIILNIILIVIFKMGGAGMLISMIGSNFIISLYLIIRVEIYKLIDFKLKDLEITKKLIKYSVPLIPNLISWWIVSVSDRTIISFFLGTTANGIYSVSNKFPTIFNGVYNVFHLSWSEQASLHYNESDRNEYFSMVVNNGIKIFGSICLLVITILPIIFNIFISSNYSDSYYQIPILMCGTLCNIIIGLISVVYIARKKSNELAKTSVIAAIINILTNIIFIKYIGLYAASISTFVAYFSMLIFRWFDIKKYVKIKLEKMNLFILLIGIIISIFTYYLNAFIINIIVFILSGVLLIYINKGSIKNIKIFLKNKVKKG